MRRNPISKKQKRQALALAVCAAAVWALALSIAMPEPDPNDLRYWVVIDCRIENCKSGGIR